MELQGTHVFVTGANRGIGRALVGQLLSRGVETIYATARKDADCEALSDLDPRITPIKLDVTDAAAVQSLGSTVTALDLLINNAGSLAGYSLLETPRAQVQRDFDVNFWGALDVTKALLPALRERKGAVLNVLTLVSMASMAGIGGYAASKAAAWSMTQALRKELGAQGIDVYGTYPGAVDTDMIRGFEMDKTKPELVAANMLDGLAQDVRDSFPDPMAQQAGAAWLDNPRQLEEMFASM